MEGSIVVGKTESNTIKFDTVQWGLNLRKEKVNFFAKPTQKGNEKDAVSIDTIKVHSNIVTFKDGEVNRSVVKDKKAKSIPGAKNKPSDSLKQRLSKEFSRKYGQRENTSR